MFASEDGTRQTIRSCHPIHRDVDKHVIIYVRISLSYHDWLERRLMMITNAPQPLQGYMYASKKAQGGTSHNTSDRVAIHERSIVADNPARIVCDRSRQLLAIM